MTDIKHVKFDPAALQAKYDAERAKRLRAEGNKQYVKAQDTFAGYVEDPYTPRVPRDPIEKDVEVAILGGGWSAILAGVELRKAGVDDFCLIDKAGDFGGVWYWNRYPGVACDTEAYVYMPMLEEMGYMPKANFASGPEIRQHAISIARKFRLYDGALLQTVVEEARWDDAAARWIITTDRGDTIRAHYFIMTSGSLQTPKLPSIPGLHDFKGHTFHTCRWDYAYTGGNEFGGLTKLRDKKVALVGTGATSIQAVPHLGASAEHLYVFQRTPSSVDYRNERPTDPEWYHSQEPGWQMRRIENFHKLIEMQPVEADIVGDGWTKPVWNVMQQLTPDMDMAEIGQLMQMQDFATCEAIRERVEQEVEDPKTAESLKAWYNRLCKRPCFHDDYLVTFNRANVTLVDTEGRGVERITEKGIVANGAEHEVDCIIFSTGFELGPYADAPVIPVLGRNGLTLAEKWKDGALTMHGIHIHGFPNFFMISIAQSAWAASFTHMMIEQAQHVAYIIEELQRRGVRTAEVTEEAEKAWVDHHVELSARVAGIWENCTPGFFNNEGKMDLRTARSGSYGGGLFGFVSVFEAWRDAGTLEGLELKRETATAA
jgi:cation diffusion facilitator CzcD-associated flavoprotein CzcO